MTTDSTHMAENGPSSFSSFSSSSSKQTVINDNPAVHAYYENLELRAGYHLVQGGPRHLGYWERDTWWPFPVAAALRRMEQMVLDRLDLHEGASVLDAGCGSAQAAAYMAQQGGLHVTGIDVVERHVEQARQTVARAGLEGQVEVRLADYHNLDWIPDESLDGIYTIETLIHATDLPRVLRNFYRVLRPGGRLVMHEYELSFEPPPPPSSPPPATSAPAEAGGAVPMEEQAAASATGHQSPSPSDPAAPPVTFLRPSHLRAALRDAGFRSGLLVAPSGEEGEDDARDLSANVRPLLRLLCWLALGPWAVAAALGLRRRFPHTVNAANGLRDQRYWRYVSLRATKPGRLVVGGKEEESRKTK